MDGRKLDTALLEVKNSYKCVESIEEIPKLKLDYKRISEILTVICLLSCFEEFQYGKDVLQTTTTIGKQFAENRQLIPKSLV